MQYTAFQRKCIEIQAARHAQMQRESAASRDESSDGSQGFSMLHTQRTEAEAAAAAALDARLAEEAARLAEEAAQDARLAEEAALDARLARIKQTADARVQRGACLVPLSPLYLGISQDRPRRLFDDVENGQIPPLTRWKHL